MFNFLCITFLLICLEHNPHIPEIINWNYSSYRTISRIRKREINLFSFSLIKNVPMQLTMGSLISSQIQVVLLQNDTSVLGYEAAHEEKVSNFQATKAPKTSTKRLSLDVILSFNYHNSWHSLSCSKVWVMFLLYLG